MGVKGAMSERANRATLAASEIGALMALGVVLFGVVRLLRGDAATALVCVMGGFFLRAVAVGIGRRLLDKVTEKFVELGARMLLADTAADNEHALAFFESAGFGNREDHVYLTKNLAKRGGGKRPKRKARPARRPTRPKR